MPLEIKSTFQTPSRDKSRGWVRGIGAVLAINKKLGVVIHHVSFWINGQYNHDGPLMVDKGGALCLPFDRKGRIGLVPIYRPQPKNRADLQLPIEELLPKLGRLSWEIPGGISLPSETVAKTAYRETLEETGIRLASLKRLGEWCGSPSFVATLDTFFYGKVSKRWKKELAPPLETEPEIKGPPRFFTRKQLGRLIKRGDLYDTRTLAAIAAFWAINPKKFN